MDIPIEINNVGMSHNRNYPTPCFWEIAGQVGNKTVIGLDAHNVGDMENMEAYEKCMELVEKYNVNFLKEPEEVLPYMERTKNNIQRN